MVICSCPLSSSGRKYLFVKPFVFLYPQCSAISAFECGTEQKVKICSVSVTWVSTWVSTWVLTWVPFCGPTFSNAPVIAGIITAILTTTLVAAINLLLAFVFYGTEGLDCSILFAPSDYVEAFIPFNITCGTLLKYQILLAFTCTLSVTGITLFLSAISKNQIVALVAAMAIFLFPVLLPITEVNPLFRLVGLLPIYHVLAISLPQCQAMNSKKVKK